jgi:ABC-type xylose transport system substrate-binding protein
VHLLAAPHAAARRKAGLAVVVVSDAGTTEAALRAHLAAHALPGAAVAIDGSGATYGAFFVKAGFFGIPRALLLDRDGKVVFEGDPGLRSGAEWQPADGPTYVDDVLTKLLGG